MTSASAVARKVTIPEPPPVAIRTVGELIAQDKRLLLLLASIAMLPIAVVALFVLYPLASCCLLVILIVFMFYACAEQRIIAKLEQAGGSSASVAGLVSFLRWVEKVRSREEHDHLCQVALWTLALEFFVYFLIPAWWDRLMYLQLLCPPLSFALVRWREKRKRRCWQFTPRRSPCAHAGSEAVREAVQRLEDAVKEKRGRGEAQRRIIAIFREIEAKELNGLITDLEESSQCRLEGVLRYLQDKEDHCARTELVKLLGLQRHADLEVEARCVIIRALMTMRLTCCTSAEEAVANLVLTLKGDELSRWKCLQDSFGFYSVHKLLCEDIRDEDRRREILDYFLHEAVSQAAERAMLADAHFRNLGLQAKKFGCVPKQLEFFLNRDDVQTAISNGAAHTIEHGRWLKIVTDMDDTMTCSGGQWPAGVDCRYPHHQSYPGVTAFYKELTVAAGGGQGQLVALSARPHVPGNFMEKQAFKAFQAMMKRDGLHDMPVLLTGDLDTGIRYVSSGGDDMKALYEKKFKDLQEYIQLYPEYKVIFIGDSGQADYQVARQMYETMPAQVEQVWIHEVTPRNKTWGYSPEHHTEWKCMDFFEDYIMAAIAGATRPNPLITTDGLKRITLAAIQDFKRIKNWTDVEQHEAEAVRLNSSIAKACEVLDERGVEVADIEPLESAFNGEVNSEGQDQVTSTTARSVGTRFGRLFRRTEDRVRSTPTTTHGLPSPSEQSDEDMDDPDKLRAVVQSAMDAGIVGVAEQQHDLPGKQASASQVSDCGQVEAAPPPGRVAGLRRLFGRPASDLSTPRPQGQPAKSPQKGTPPMLPDPDEPSQATELILPEAEAVAATEAPPDNPQSGAGQEKENVADLPEAASTGRVASVKQSFGRLFGRPSSNASTPRPGRVNSKPEEEMTAGDPEPTLPEVAPPPLGPQVPLWKDKLTESPTMADLLEAEEESTPSRVATLQQNFGRLFSRASTPERGRGGSKQETAEGDNTPSDRAEQTPPSSARNRALTDPTAEAHCHAALGPEAQRSTGEAAAPATFQSLPDLQQALAASEATQEKEGALQPQQPAEASTTSRVASLQKGIGRLFNRASSPDQGPKKPRREDAEALEEEEFTMTVTEAPTTPRKTVPQVEAPPNTPKRPPGAASPELPHGSAAAAEVSAELATAPEQAEALPQEKLPMEESLEAQFRGSTEAPATGRLPSLSLGRLFHRSSTPERGKASRQEGEGEDVGPLGADAVDQPTRTAPSLDVAPLPQAGPDVSSGDMMPPGMAEPEQLVMADEPQASDPPALAEENAQCEDAHAEEVAAGDGSVSAEEPIAVSAALEAADS